MNNHIEMEETPAVKQDKGFTLVELLIVIVILGILATVTVFAVRGITDQGKASTCKADLKTLEVAAEAYVAQYGNAAIPISGQTPEQTAPVGATWSPGASVEQTLVNAGLLRGVSSNYDVTATGGITLASPNPNNCPNPNPVP